MITLIKPKRGYLSTKKQLKSWGLNYNKLIFGKPSFDLIVDDKAIFDKSWGKNFESFKNIMNSKSIFITEGWILW